MITGNDLIAWGFTPGEWFGRALAEAQRLEAQGASVDEIVTAIDAMRPPDPIGLQDPVRYTTNLVADHPDERANLEAVHATMTELVRTPTIRAATVMPDACPAGPPGTIPVGGVIAADNAVHPGAHSADVCCSVAISVYDNADPADIMDRAHRATHFGGGGRPRSGRIPVAEALLRAFAGNEFLNGLEDEAQEHMGTQGDGNHFLFVGRLASTGQVAVVTHHGSRKPGALLYKRAMKAAERYRQKLSPETYRQNAWIPMDTQDGAEYWGALQMIREWTKRNHFAIHDGIGLDPVRRFWNEHNFVFERDGLYYHGKGATPAWDGFAADSEGLTLIPLNMAEPVLVTRGLDAANGLGFCPHGAGRNFSRSEHGRRIGGSASEADIVARETAGLDVRFYSGQPDISELPSAYKSAAAVQRQIDQFGLAEVVDRVEPYGCIMAGNWTRNIRRRRRQK